MKPLRSLLISLLIVGLLMTQVWQATPALAATVKLPTVFANVEASWRVDSPYPTFLRGRMPAPVTMQAASLQDAEVARGFLAEHAQIFGISNVAHELHTVATDVDTLGISHITFQQVSQGVPVYNSLIKVHLDRSANTVLAVGNGYVSGIVRSNTKPAVSSGYALHIAQNFLPAPSQKTQPTLVIYPGAGVQRSATQARLAWLVDLQNVAAHKLFIIDAQQGKLLDVLERTYSSQAEDNSQFNTFQPTVPVTSTAKRIATYSAGNTENLPGKLMRIDDEPPVGDLDLDNAHEFAQATYEYYLKTHGRNSFDDKGAVIISTVHYGQNVQNAFWNGEQMIYGDGFPILDVVGHELTHAVTNSTSNLEYRWQSGALNESFSDIFGAMIDREDWLIGEDIASEVFGQEAFRDMAQPERFDQPGHTDAWVKTCIDQEGVHINSGIFNKAYYNIATAIGKEQAERIFYRTLIQYLQPTSGFQDARSAVLQATDDLYATLAVSVTKGFDDVGITATWQPEPNECPCVAVASLTSAGSKQTLDLLRTLRDAQMSQAAAGRYYTELYYQVTADVSLLLLANSELRTRTGQMIELFTPGLRNLVAGQGADSMVTKEMVVSLQRYLADLKQDAQAAGNQSLADIITIEEARIDWSRLPGMTFAEGWDYISSLGGFFQLYLPTVQH